MSSLMNVCFWLLRRGSSLGEFGTRNSLKLAIISMFLFYFLFIEIFLVLKRAVRACWHLGTFFHTNVDADGASVIYSTRRVGSGAGFVTHPESWSVSSRVSSRGSATWSVSLSFDPRIRFEPVPDPHAAVLTFFLNDTGTVYNISVSLQCCSFWISGRMDLRCLTGYAETHFRIRF
jgi:hypothetical protein